MSPLRARVVKGQFVIAARTSLPEGTVLDLVVDDEGDTLDDAERAALHARLATAWESVVAGAGRPAAEFLEDLRVQR